MARIAACLLGIITVLSVAQGAAPASGGSPAVSSSLVPVGQSPPVPAGSVDNGPVSSATSIHLSVTLKPRDPAALAAFVQGVSTPGSTFYRRYLGPGEFASRFGATDATIKVVTDGLRRRGLDPGRVSANHLSIPVTASASTVASAFATQLHSYAEPGGRVAYANTSRPSVQSDAAGAVQSVLGLDDLAQARPGLVTSRSAPASASSGSASAPESPAPGAPAPANGPSPCAAASQTGGYTADKLAAAYKIDGLYATGDLGGGQTVALFELADFSDSDISAYQSCYGTTARVVGPHTDPTLAIDGGAPVPGPSTSGNMEATADVEDVIGLAPRSDVLVYEAPNTTQGLLDEYAKMVTDDRAKVISSSWGICEAILGSGTASAEDTIFEQAAAQGQTVMVATLDDGSEGCNQFTGSGALAVDDPASQPYVTAVGGTQLADSGPSQNEVTWDVPGFAAGGGGISGIWPMPTWQSGSGIVSGTGTGSACAAPSGSCRETPDVSADAASSPGGYTFYCTSGDCGSEYGLRGWSRGFGGTSFATPLWAAIAALTDESCGADVGFVDPSLYRLAASASPPFNDVTGGDNDFLRANSGLYGAGPGYDMATGLGTPVVGGASGLASQLCGLSAVPSINDISPDSGPTTGSPPVTIDGRGFRGATAVMFGSTPATSFTVGSDDQIFVGVPPSPAAGTVNVTVASRTGASAASGGAAYTYFAPPLPYHALTPYRIADTRSGSGDAYAGRTLGPGSSLGLQVTGVGGPLGQVVPDDATAVVMNVTAVAPSQATFLTVWPAGQSRPWASNLNPNAGTIEPNLVEVGLGVGGRVSFYNQLGISDVVVDVEGYVAPDDPTSANAGLFNPIVPFRIADTRPGSGRPYSGQTLVRGDDTRTVQATGVGGVPESGVSAVAVNVTVVNPSAGSFVTLWPADGARPLTSNLNFGPRQVVPNRVIVPVSSTGKISIYNDVGSTDVVVDVGGWYTDSSAPARGGYQFSPAPDPLRVADTRKGQAGLHAGRTLAQPSQSDPLGVQVAGYGVIPSGARAVVANVTAVDTTAASYLTAWPFAAPIPYASDLNWAPGQTVANLMVTKLDPEGMLGLFNAVGSTDVVVDIEGWYS